MNNKIANTLSIVGMFLVFLPVLVFFYGMNSDSQADQMRSILMIFVVPLVILLALPLLVGGFLLNKKSQTNDEQKKPGGFMSSVVNVGKVLLIITFSVGLIFFLIILSMLS